MGNLTMQQAALDIGRALKLGLSGADWLYTLGPEKVAAAYNGIGPERMPEKWRARLDSWLWLFRVPCELHDCRFVHDNDGTEAKFRAANDELERNNLIVADAEYAWYNPLRYVWRRRARLVAWACREFGWSAWRDAFEKNQKGETT